LVKKATIVVADKIRVYKPRKARVLVPKVQSQVTYVMRELLKLSGEDRQKILNFFK
jgi:hypothetical protein